jgi:hypothetical protein
MAKIGARAIKQARMGIAQHNPSMGTTIGMKRRAMPQVALHPPFGRYCGGAERGLEAILGHAPPMGRFSSVRESFDG